MLMLYGVYISRILRLRAACSQPAIGHQPSRSALRYTYGGQLMCIDSLLNRRYLQVSGSVRVRVRARVSARVITVRDRDRI